jgi:hypothetical protein
MNPYPAPMNVQLGLERGPKVLEVASQSHHIPPHDEGMSRRDRGLIGRPANLE